MRKVASPLKRTRGKARAASIDRTLREKYLHSQAAAWHDEGSYDQAIASLQAALEVEEQPYTRYQLALTCLAGKNLDRALVEITRAIEMAPSTPEYYYRRGGIRREMGDDAGAGVDLKQAIRLDENYPRIERIREAARVCEQALDVREFLDRCRAKEVRDRELQAIIRAVEAPPRALDEALEGSCPVRTCPPYCCYFSHEMVVHGATIGGWKLHAIRQMLKNEGLAESGFLQRLEYGGEEHLSRLIPPHHILKEGGCNFVYYPGRAGRALGRTRLKDLPKGRDYRSLVWITETAKPCAFLRDGKCLVYDAGGEASLDACRQFLCMTGMVFLVAKHFGLVADTQLQGKNIGELNAIAIEILLVLAERIFSDERLARIGVSLDDALRLAIEADSRGDRRALALRIDNLRRVHEEHLGLQATLHEQAKQNIAALFETL